MSAPAALAVAKISMPSTEKNEKAKKLDLGQVRYVDASSSCLPYQRKTEI